MHAVSYFLTPRSGARDELLQELCVLAREIRQDPGCVVCAVCVEESAGLLLVVSGWKGAEDMQRHLRSEHFRVLSGASPLLGASAEVGFFTSDPARSP